MKLSLWAVLALLLVSHPQAHSSTLQFGKRQDIQTHFQHLVGAAVADFNGDGVPDIAVTDLYANQITVYVNQGHGTFGTPIVTPLTTTGYFGPGKLVSGDVNEDGNQDLIVAPIGGSQYDIVLLGNGDGTFRIGQVIKTAFGFDSATLTDVNHDKHLDLISAGNAFADVELGDGKGNFTQKPVPPTNPPTQFRVGLAVGDYNGDGNADILTSAYNALALEVYKSSSDGTLQVPVQYPSNVFGTAGAQLAPGDFNGDGKLDFALGTFDIAAIVFGNGDGTFQLGADQISTLPTAGNTVNPDTTAGVNISAVDMNGDGTLDVAVADDGTEFANVLLNDGKGNFTLGFSAPLDAGSGTISVADLNGDGLPDLVVTNYVTQKISIFLSIVQKTTPTVSVVSSAAQSLVGSSVAITVQVTGAAAHSPTGTVSLASGATSYGQQTLGSGGQATFTLSNLATGQYPLVATYVGDAYNNAVSSATSATQSITDFQVTVPSASQSVGTNASATYGVTITPLAGFTGSVSLGCSGLPAGYSCAPLTSSISGQAAAAALIVTPPATTASSQPVRPYSHIFLALWGCLGFGLRRRKWKGGHLLSLCAFVLCIGSIAGCSGNSSPKAAPYTGTTTFAITASTTQGALTVSHQTTATLTVHQ